MEYSSIDLLFCILAIILLIPLVVHFIDLILTALYGFN